jgi:hypothetical protein
MAESFEEPLSRVGIYNRVSNIAVDILTLRQRRNMDGMMS